MCIFYVFVCSSTQCKLSDGQDLITVININKGDIVVDELCSVLLQVASFQGG